MTKSRQNRPRLDSCSPPITDTVVRLDSHGCPVYVSMEEALLSDVESCILWVVNHPTDVLHGLGWAALAAGSLYLAYDAMQSPRRPARRRR
jgi:hypothetical protein